MPRRKVPKLYGFLLKLFHRIEKRQRFILATGLLALIYTSATFFSIQSAIVLIPIIFLLVYVMTFFSILEGITRHEWIMLFIVPIYFSVVFYLFYFFVPQRWLTRIPFVTIYAIGIYAIMLSQNIFNVGVSKSLQLYRAAHSVNYLVLTICSFLAFSLVISLRLNFLFNFIIITLLSFPLAIHMLWSVQPKDVVSKDIFMFATLISLLLGQGAALFSFMPLNQSIFSLGLTASFYSLVGLFQLNIQGALFKERIREYIFVVGFAALIIILTINW